MNELLAKISEALGGLGLGQVYYGVYTGADPLIDHITAIPQTVEHIEADNKRLWLTNTVEVSLFTLSSNVWQIADAAQSALEAKNIAINAVNYFIDNATKQHQIDIIVQDSDFA